MSGSDDRTVDDVLRDRWDERLTATPRDWFDEALLELLEPASVTRLRGLFFYTSHNTLHFTRCSDWPFTDDLPWIWFYPGEPFQIHGPGIHGPGVTETGDAASAVELVAAALPPDPVHVWLGRAS